MKQITGKIIRGLSAASGSKINWGGLGSIQLQVEYLRRAHPAFALRLDSCVKATINIELVEELFLERWEFVFDKIAWLPACSNWSETLAFTPIILEYQHLKADAWIYKAFRSPHANNPKLLEVIAPQIDPLIIDSCCVIHIGEVYF